MEDAGLALSLCDDLSADRESGTAAAAGPGAPSGVQNCLPGPGLVPGAESRLRALMDAHFDFIWRSLRRLGLSSADADDAAQQVFWVAARKLELIDEGRERAYLFGTALRVAADARRAQRRRPTAALEVEVADPAPLPDELSDRRRARRALDAILETLPLDMRTVFVLFELEELSVSEIATLCSIPVGTVGSRLRRARELFSVAVKRHRARGGNP